MRRAGYSLIEMLACIALLAALFPAASKLYVSITRLHAAQTAALDRMTVFDQVEHDLRAAARGALNIEPSFGAFKTEKRTVVLRNRVGYTVFTTNEHFQPQRIRFTPQTDGTWEQRITTYPQTAWRSRFEAQNSLVSFTARPPHKRRAGKTPVAEVHVLAAVGLHGGGTQ
jgi:prepilin-type N-terminal cleavage/methylation domain-containing protein